MWIGKAGCSRDRGGEVIGATMRHNFKGVGINNLERIWADLGRGQSANRRGGSWRVPGEGSRPSGGEVVETGFGFCGEDSAMGPCACRVRGSVHPSCGRIANININVCVGTHRW
jgi:hypothetical protein